MSNSSRLVGVDRGVQVSSDAKVTDMTPSDAWEEAKNFLIPAAAVAPGDVVTVTRVEGDLALDATTTLGNTWEAFLGYSLEDEDATPKVAPDGTIGTSGPSDTTVTHCVADNFGNRALAVNHKGSEGKRVRCRVWMKKVDINLAEVTSLCTRNNRATYDRTGPRSSMVRQQDRQFRGVG